MKRKHGGRPISGRRVRRNAWPAPRQSLMSLFAAFCKRTEPAYIAHADEFKFRVWYSGLEKRARRRFHRRLRSGAIRRLPDKGYREGDLLDLGDGVFGLWTGFYAVIRGKVTLPGSSEALFNGGPGFGHG